MDPDAAPPSLAGPAPRRLRALGRVRVALRSPVGPHGRLAQTACLLVLRKIRPQVVARRGRPTTSPPRLSTASLRRRPRWPTGRARQSSPPRLSLTAGGSGVCTPDSPHIAPRSASPTRAESAPLALSPATAAPRLCLGTLINRGLMRCRVRETEMAALDSPPEMMPTGRKGVDGGRRRLLYLNDASVELRGLDGRRRSTPTSKSRRYGRPTPYHRPCSTVLFQSQDRSFPSQPLVPYGLLYAP